MATKKNEIVPVEQVDAILLWAKETAESARAAGRLPNFYKAAQALATMELPPEWVQERKGRGGTKLKYISHVRANRVMLEIAPFFSLEQGPYELFGQGKTDAGHLYPLEVVSTVALKIPVFLGDQEDGKPQIYDRRIEERGVFMNDLKLGHASAIAAASSRGFVKCFTRATGLGLSLYGDDEPTVLTPQDIYEHLVAYATKKDITEAEFKKISRELGVTSMADLADDEMYQKHLQAINSH
jgi:hypothetical protein